jgi:hypothetical protein
MDYTLQFISTQWGLLVASFAFDPVLLSEPGIVFRLVLLVTVRLRRIPVVGDAIEESGWLITVEDTNDRSALRLRLEPV